MKTEYIEELGKNYLMICSGLTEHEFAVRMLSENKIQGLLAFERRTFNGDAQYFYDISGKHALLTDLQNHLLSGEDLSCLLRSLYCLAEDIRSYFLEMKGVILDLNMIFRDEKAYYFCYDPSAVEDTGKALESFAEELPCHIDHDDEDAVTLGYSFYKLIRAGDKALLQILEEVLSEKNEKSPWQEDYGETAKEDVVVISERSEESFNEKKFVKCKKPDVGTLFFFAGALLVSLGYLIEILFFSEGGSVFDILREGAGKTVFLFVFLSLPGMAAAFVDIDIKAKK